MTKIPLLMMLTNLQKQTELSTQIVATMCHAHVVGIALAREVLVVYGPTAIDRSISMRKRAPWFSKLM